MVQYGNVAGTCLPRKEEEIFPREIVGKVSFFLTWRPENRGFGQWRQSRQIVVLLVFPKSELAPMVGATHRGGFQLKIRNFWQSELSRHRMDFSKNNEFTDTGNEHPEARRHLGKYSQKEIGTYKELGKRRMVFTFRPEMNIYDSRRKSVWNNEFLAK